MMSRHIKHSGSLHSCKTFPLQHLNTVMKRLSLVCAFLLISLAIPSPRQALAQDPFIGEIRLVGFTYCPRGWTDANGQLLNIVDHQALFSLYGTTYGGDGRTTFALPDLRSRVPVHLGQGTGLSDYVLGESGGQETVTLQASEMPTHNHSLNELTTPNGNTPGLVIRNGGGEQAVNTTDAGSGAAHENRPPFLAIRFCIALEGIFPSRN